MKRWFSSLLKHIARSSNKSNFHGENWLASTNETQTSLMFTTIMIATLWHVGYYFKLLIARIKNKYLNFCQYDFITSLVPHHPEKLGNSIPTACFTVRVTRKYVFLRLRPNVHSDKCTRSQFNTCPYRHIAFANLTSH